MLAETIKFYIILATVACILIYMTFMRDDNE